MKDLLLNIDRRIIFIFIALGVIIPSLSAFKLPIKPTNYVRAVYDTVEEVAQKEGTVLISFDYGPGSDAEIQPMAMAILRQCFRNNVKVVSMCHWPDAVGLAEKALAESAREFGAQSGVDYTFLGYKTGGGTLVLGMGQDFHGTFPQDTQGNNTTEIAVTKNIKSLTDLDYVISLAAGNTPEQAWIPFGQERYRFKFGVGCTAVMAPDQYPFLQSGQMNGLIGGLAGAAEYEALVNKPAKATAGMGAQSVVHVIIILFIILGNVMYFMYGRQTGGAK